MLTTEDMKNRLGIKSTRPLADFLPTLTIAAKNLATEMTNYNVEQKDLYGEHSITTEHMDNNRSIRQMLGQRGIRPEELPRFHHSTPPNHNLCHSICFLPQHLCVVGISHKMR